MLALQQKTVDIAANWWNAEDDSTSRAWSKKGLAEEGRLPHHLQVRPDPQLALRLPRRPAADLKAAIAKAFDEAPTKAKAAFDKLSDGKDREFMAVDAKYYEGVVELIKFIDSLRKQKS